MVANGGTLLRVSFIELSRLTEIGISKPVPYLTQLFPSGIAFPRVFVSPAVVETVCVSRIDVGNNPFTRYVVGAMCHRRPNRCRHVD